jgi:hypothetical protein
MKCKGPSALTGDLAPEIWLEGNGHGVPFAEFDQKWQAWINASAQS